MKRLMTFIMIAALGSALNAPAALAADPAGAQHVKHISAYVGPSIVRLETDYAAVVYDKLNDRFVGAGEDAQKFEAAAFCTGYIVNPDGYIATAGHCVQADLPAIEANLKRAAAEWAVENAYYEDESLTVDQVLETDSYRSYQVFSVDTKNRGADRTAVEASWEVSAGGVKVPESKAARVIDFKRFTEGDGALLKVEASGLSAIKLAEEGDLEIGDNIVAIGYPGSVDSATDLSFVPSYEDGKVSSKKSTNGGLFPVYEVSGIQSHGMSGGPAVNGDGNVVGFVSFGDSTEKFNFVRPAANIKELMAGAGIRNERGEVGDNYKAGLDAYFSGDKEKAVKSFQAVLDAQPAHLMAGEYLQKAKELPDGFPFALAGVIGAVVLILLGLVGVLLMRRKGELPGATRSVPFTEPPNAPSPSPAPTISGPVSSTSSEESVRSVGFGTHPRDSGTMENRDLAHAFQAGPESGSRVCPSCGSPSDAGKRFCGECGSAL